MARSKKACLIFFDEVDAIGESAAAHHGGVGHRGVLWMEATGSVTSLRWCSRHAYLPPGPVLRLLASHTCVEADAPSSQACVGRSGAHAS
jgi:hypothetical protein